MPRRLRRLVRPLLDRLSRTPTALLVVVLAVVVGLTRAGKLLRRLGLGAW